MTTLATLVVSLVGDIGGFLKSMDKAEQEAKGIGGRISGAIGGGLQAIGNVAAVAAGATVAAVGAIGTAAFTSAMELDDAYDTIRTGTGATGDALEALKKDFQTVFTGVPTDVGAAASAVTILNERLGVTGPFLTDLAKPLLEVSRLTGGDASQNAALFSRVIGDWAIPLEDASTSLDALFVASQETAVPLDQLMDQVVKFGSPLRLMGFSFEESAALIAKFEKEGVNTELVLGALRVAAGKFAKDQIPLQKGLQDTITRIRDTKDSSEALALGMKIFGARAGPDMVAAIREGRFALGDLVEAMQNADGAILQTAQDTADFPEKFETLKNKVEVALAPVGMLIMDAIGGALDAIGPIIERVLPIVVDFFGQFLSGAQTALGWVQANVGPIFDLVMGVIGTVVAWVQTNWPLIQQTIVTAIQNAYNAVKPIVEAIWTVISTVFNVVKKFIDDHGAEIKGFLSTAWNAIRDIVSGISEIIRTIVVEVWGAMAKFVEENQEGIRTVIEFVWNTISLFVGTILEVIRGIVNAVLALLRGDVQGALDAIKGIFINVWGLIKDTVQGAVTTMQQILAIAWAAIQTAVTNAWEAIRTTIETAWNQIKDNVETAWNAIKTTVENAWQSIITTLENAWQSVIDFLGSIPDRMVALGEAIIEGIVQGLRNAGDAIGRFLQGLIDDAIQGIKDALGIASTSKVMERIGEELMRGLATGIGRQADLPELALERISADMATRFEDRGPGGPEPVTQQDNRQFVLNVYEAGRAVNVAHDFELLRMLAG